MRSIERLGMESGMRPARGMWGSSQQSGMGAGCEGAATTHDWPMRSDSTGAKRGSRPSVQRGTEPMTGGLAKNKIKFRNQILN
jgi:hypothetical protein